MRAKVNKSGSRAIISFKLLDTYRGNGSIVFFSRVMHSARSLRGNMVCLFRQYA